MRQSKHKEIPWEVIGILSDDDEGNSEGFNFHGAEVFTTCENNSKNIPSKRKRAKHIPTIAVIPKRITNSMAKKGPKK
jgi:hypothetical protein